MSTYEAALSAAFAFSCLLVMIVACCQKPRAKIVCRLALCLVLASYLSATIELVQVFSEHYKYSELCAVIGGLVLCLRWVKLLFVMHVSLHLFSFVVFKLNQKKLEMWYMLISFLVPLVMVPVYLMTMLAAAPIQVYGCFVNIQNGTQNVAFIVECSLWYVPSSVLLLAATVVVIVIGTKLANQIHKKYHNEEESSHDDIFWDALKRLIPLVSFPILFITIQLPMNIYHIIELINIPFSTNEAIAITIMGMFTLCFLAMAIILPVHVVLGCLAGIQK